MVNPFVYRWEAPDGTVLEIWLGDHVRRWRTIPGVPHDFIAAHRGTAYHSPGPGECIRTDSIDTILAGAIWVQIISRASSMIEVNRRMAVCTANVGIEWRWGSNCQDFCTFVTNGKAESFHRDVLYGAGLGLGLLLLLGTVTNQQPRRRYRSRRHPH